MAVTSTSCASRTERAGRFGLIGVLGWLALLAMGAAQPLSLVNKTQAPPRCVIEQKKPLYVGFVSGMGLDAFEPAALASRDVVRQVKRWACEEQPAASYVVLSLQRALSAPSGVGLLELQFDDLELAHAHVLLGSVRRHWRVDMLRGERGWSVANIRVAPAPQATR